MAAKAIVQGIEGEVSVVRNGQTVAVAEGDTLLPGDQIITGANGRMALEFPGLPGQQPAAGIMGPNGTVQLAAQPGLNGQQMVVMDDADVFDFTSDVGDQSAAVEAGSTSAMGLFGAGLAGGGSLMAAGGAVAAGAFLIGGSGGGGDDAAPTAPSSGGSSSPPPGGNSGGNNSGNLTPPPVAEEETDEELPEEETDEEIPDGQVDVGEQFGPEGVEALVATLQETLTNPESLPENLQALGEGVAAQLQAIATDPQGAVESLAGQLQALADGGVDISPLGDLSATRVAGELADAATPLTEAIEPLDQVFDAIQDGAAQLDAALAPVQGGLQGAIADSPLADLGPEALTGPLTDALSSIGSRVSGGDSPLPDLPGSNLLG